MGRELAAQSLGGHLGKGAAQFPVQRCCLAGGPSLGLRLASAESWAVLQGAAGFFVDLCRTCAQLVLSCMAGRGVRPHPPQFLAAGAGLDMPTCGRPSPHPQRPRIPPWAAGAHSRFPRRKRREKTATIRHMCLPGKRNTFCRKSRLTKAHPRSPSLFLPGPSPVCASTWHAAHSAVHRGPGWRCAPSHLAPGQGSDCQLTRQQEVGAFDDQRGRKRGLRLPSPWGGRVHP